MSIPVVAQVSGRGTIRGSATLGGQPLPGIVLTLRRDYLNRVDGPLRRAETDPEGRYQFDDVPPGKYVITLLSPHLVPAEEDPQGYLTRTVVMAEGGTLDNINLSLQRGGAVTGKITDANGYPVIGKKVSYERLSSNGQVMYTTGIQVYEEVGITDDRGIYRLFGLYSGRYRIYIGDRSRPQGVRPPYHEIPPLTFYPGARDVARAEIIEVKAGAELTRIDIKLSAPDRAFVVVGRVIDAQTGAPILHVPIGYRATEGGAVLQVRTNDRGEFRYENCAVGQYSFYAFFGPESEHYSEQTPVEVKEGNVEDVIIKAHRGMAVSGWITIEGNPDTAVLAQIPELGVWAFLRSQKPFTPKNNQQRIDANGSFAFKGLEPGHYEFRVFKMGGSPLAFNLMRVESQGVAGEGIDVAPGQNLTDVRLVIAVGTGAIRGRVQTSTESIELPGNAYLQITARPKRNFSNGFGVGRADRHGNFTIEGLSPGEYEVNVGIDFDQQPAQRDVFISRNSSVVTVKGGSDTKVVLPVEIFKEGRR